ncbi:MAG: TIGR00153 family protein [Thermotogota bacterium]|nr:TIGR00153 family protein [Thermotogota bacterium]
MLFVGKKEQDIIKHFKKHIKAVEETLGGLEQLLETYKKGDSDDLEKVNDIIHERESEADKIRRSMETEMYQGAFLPNFRGDFLGLVENFDRIANRAEGIADHIILTKIVIPDELINDLVDQVKMSLKTYKSLKGGAEKLFDDLEEAAELVLKTEKLEHDEDQFERDLIKKIFSMDLELAHKNQLRELVMSIGDLADLSEDCSDRIEIVVLKRKV